MRQVSFFALAFATLAAVGCATAGDEGWSDVRTTADATRTDTSTTTGHDGATTDTPPARDVIFSTDTNVGGCDPGQTLCETECVDLQSDNRDCGACFHACSTGQTCVNGTCTTQSSTCPPPLQSCGGTCVNTQTDVNNCGFCGDVCSPGQSCVSGTCSTSGTTGGSGTIGAACTSDSACPTGGACAPASLGWPGGYCLSFGCNTNADCGTGGLCVMSGSSTLCVQSCSGSCRTGYRCVNLGTSSACLPDCTVDPALMCGAGYCDPSTGQCDASCSRSSDCAVGAACDTFYGECYCTASTNCGSGFACDTSSGYCGCTSDAVCGPGHTCDRSTGTCNL